MKRALLIAGGTIGGLGAVMTITPPQFTSSSTLAIGGMADPTATTTSSPAAQPTTAGKATPAATKSTAGKATPSKTTAGKATPAATKKPTAQVTQSTGGGTTSNSTGNTNSGTVATDPAPAAPASINGTFTGPSVYVQYGNVQVQITVVNGRITDAVAVVAPSGKNDRYTNMAVPLLKKQTLAAQSDAIQGASGASYTSYGWFKSLQGALAKAGL